MNKYKLVAIKVAIIAAITLFLNTEVGKPYAAQVKPIIEMVLQYDWVAHIKTYKMTPGVISGVISFAR